MYRSPYVAEIPLGKQGLLTDLGSSEIPHTALIKATNLQFANGYLEKAPGSILYNTNGPFTAGVVGLTDYFPTSVQQRMLVATADGKIWKDRNDRTFSNMTPIATNVANGALTNACQFILGGAEAAARPKKVFFFSGGLAQVQVINGDQDTVGPIALPAADWPNPTISSNPQSNFPKFGLIHRGSLWCFAKSVAYASSTSNHEDFQSVGTLINNVGPGEGGDITGAFVYKSRLFVFKEGDFVYYLNDSDTSNTNWYFTKFAEGFGISSLHGACQVIDDLLVGSNTGAIDSFKATLNFGSVSQGDILKLNKVSSYYRQYTSQSGLPFQQAMYYPEKGLGLFSTRSTYTTMNDVIIQYDVSNPMSPKFGLWNHYQIDAMSLRRDINNIMRPIFGGVDGNVYLGDRATRAVNTLPYLAEFKTPYLDMRHLDPGLAQKNKIFDYLAVTFTPEGNHNLSVDVWIDNRYSETLNFAQTTQVEKNYLGAFKLGTNKLGTDDEDTIYQPLHGTGRRISLRGYNGNALENFKVSLFSLGFRVAGESATI